MESIILTFFTAIVVVLVATPSIISVATHYKIFDFPGERKLHTDHTPRLGGMAIFLAFLFSFFLWRPSTPEPSLRFIIASMLILFLVGLKDDIVGISPLKKLGFQLLVSLIVVIDGIGATRLTSLHGIFNIYEIPYWLSILISVFTVIVITNAFNLIDGIDGLASGLGLIACSVFGFWFYSNDNLALACMAFSLGGALLGILVFNFAPARIFSGDCGSLIIGFLISMLSIRFAEINLGFINSYLTDNQGLIAATGIAGEGAAPLMIYSAPAFVAAVLIIPLYDTLRIFIVRIFHGRSPFMGDTNHIHHRLMFLGLTAPQVCLLLYFINILFIVVAYQLRDMSPNKLLLIILGMALLLDGTLTLLKRRKTNREALERK